MENNPNKVTQELPTDTATFSSGQCAARKVVWLPLNLCSCASLPLARVQNQGYVHLLECEIRLRGMRFSCQCAHTRTGSSVERRTTRRRMRETTFDPRMLRLRDDDLDQFGEIEWLDEVDFAGCDASHWDLDGQRCSHQPPPSTTILLRSVVRCLSSSRAIDIDAGGRRMWSHFIVLWLRVFAICWFLSLSLSSLHSMSVSHSNSTT